MLSVVAYINAYSRHEMSELAANEVVTVLLPFQTPMFLSLGTVLEDPEIWPEPAR